MKKITFCLLAIIVPALSFSQTSFIAKGKILDAATKQPLQAASVFAENTTLGTATDGDGNFALYLPNGGYNLVITFTGYQTETKRITSGDDGNNSIVVELKQKQKELEDVVVKASFEVKDGWEKYGNFFLENFIGKTANSQECTVKNKETLHFFYYKRKNRLKILADAPVEIVNNALGYSIKYTLDSFTHEYNTQVSQYTGYPLFRELEPLNDEQKNRWKANRLVAYNGSILHFMRSMYQKKLKEEGFEIQFLLKENEKERALPLRNFYAAVNYKMDDTAKTVEILPNQKEVAVLYKNEEPSKLFLEANTDASAKFQLSVVSFLPNESLEIEQNGYYYEQDDITITGYWAWEKVADMLPYNFADALVPVVAKDEVVTSPTIVPQQTTKPTDLLTSIAWKAEESRIIEGNNITYYKRGGQQNSINLDNDLYKFNADNTGTWTINGQDYKFTWNYSNTEKTKIKMVIQYPTPLVVDLENIVINATSFSYTRLQQLNGVNLMAIETRTVK
ncbi:MAG: carboxypeptidase-like regulatory domain-containing protein [Chitinophagaceae bacterium]|nr:carboxypeptidase-like regulatory domain-containing protein [Chitinophagaceae bacterium]